MLSRIKKHASHLIYGAIFLSILALLLFGWTTKRLTEGHLITGAISIVGTFLGALFAFRLNQSKEDQAHERENKAALNRALFVLSRQENAVTVLKRDYDKFQIPEVRAVNLPARKPPLYTDVRQDMASLEFLIERNYGDLLFRLLVEDERFHQVLSAIETRNDFYVHEFQVAMEREGLNDQQVNTQQLATQLGERIYSTNLLATNAAATHLALSEASLPQMFIELRGSALTMFPGSRFIKFEKIQKTTIPEQPA